MNPNHINLPPGTAENTHPLLHASTFFLFCFPVASKQSFFSLPGHPYSRRWVVFRAVSVSGRTLTRSTESKQTHFHGGRNRGRTFPRMWHVFLGQTHAVADHICFRV